jgi:outer membrane protein assembly factor BamB
MLALIPTFVLVGPLSLLAWLLPAVFGGLALALRRGRAFLIILALDSLLYLAHCCLVGYLGDCWWTSPATLWVTLGLIALLGVAWTQLRRRDRVPAAVGHPSAGRWRITLEGMMLAALALVCAIQAARSRPGSQTLPGVEVIWTFVPAERGAIISSPLVAGNRVYVAAIHDAGFSTSGAVYSLDRATGKRVWKFDDEGQMQQVYSSPCLSDGRLYIGEGMHANYVCKLYCLDVATGHKLWHFKVDGHIESSPCVSGDRVFFGAGDDGLYCLDSVTGALRWHFQGPFHIDSSPCVADHSVYFGSGVSRRFQTFEIFCLNTEDGTVRWRVPVDLPAWGAPAVDGGQVYIGLGNGRLDETAPRPQTPAGALLCLPAGTGQPCLWRFSIGDAVFAKPTVDQKHVYFGAHDGYCYALERSDGRLCWKQDLGSPVLTRPALLDGRLYVVARDGRVWGLDATNGAARWLLDVSKYSRARPQLLSSPAVLAEEISGHHRIYLGAELSNPVSSAAAIYCLED